MLANLAPVGIFLSDNHGKAIFVNRRWCKLAGLTEKEALGQGWLTAVHPDDRARVMSGWRDAVHDRASSYAEFRFRHRDGTIRWIHGEAVEWRTAEGGLGGYIGTVVDITDHKKNESALRENGERLQMAMEAAQMVSWEMDLATEKVVWSTNMERVLGFALPDKFSAAAAFLHPDDREQTLAVIAEAGRDGQKQKSDSRIPQLEFRLIHPETGGLNWMRAQGILMRNTADGVVRFVGIAQNITEQKRHEQELRRSEQLRRAISKSVQFELQRARDEALAASRAKDDFLAALSHELRTPLNPVLLLASEAAEDAALTQEVRDQFAMIRDNVELEARLIDDLLDLTRISRGKLTLDVGVVDIQAILKDAIATVQMELDEKRLKLTADISSEKLYVRGDVVRLRQIFWNVLKNAVRFTPEGGEISVRAGFSSSGKEIVIAVTDSGMGMTAEELERVFNAFTQGEHAEQAGITGHHFGGLGLGLAISRRLVEMHQGEIRGESPGRGKGSKFTITLPLVAKPPAESVKPSNSPGSGISANTSPGGIRVLLVEDHEPTRKALAHLLKRRKYQVETAGSLAEARALAKKYEFQLLISDIGLPDGDGYALMMELGRDRHLKGIALTGYGMEHDVAFSQSAGFVAHLTKPVRVESLESALAAALIEN